MNLGSHLVNGIPNSRKGNCKGNLQCKFQILAEKKGRQILKIAAEFKHFSEYSEFAVQAPEC